MAITQADFSKIWASTSPLTPYDFSESNYKEGWNFVGGTPPSRQMWDFLQKNNDEKMQYLANNYLPLSGGTINGTVKFSTDNALSRNTTDGEFIIYGGEANFNSPCIALRGQEKTTDAGTLYIRVKNTSQSKDLIAKPDGTLTWGGNNVITSGKFVSIAQVFEHTYTTTDWEQVGSITIPPKCVYFIRLSNSYTSSRPNGAVITSVTGTNAIDNCLAITENQSVWNCIVYHSGATLSNSENYTLYLYGRYPYTTENQSYVNGWYIETT